MFNTLLVNYLFLMTVTCLPTEISKVGMPEKFSATFNENSNQNAELEVDFEYNEDYSQIKIGSQENVEYTEFTTQNMNNINFKNHSVTVDDYDLKNFGNVNNIAEENSMDNEKIVLNQLSSIFNIGQITATENISNDFMPPQFMTDLYHTITEQNNNILQNIVYGASAIISLPETNPSSPSLFKFDLSGISDQDILEAELHVYRIGREVSIPLHHSPYYLLRVYQVQNNNLMTWNPDVHKLLNVHYVSSFITGWQRSSQQSATASNKRSDVEETGPLSVHNNIFDFKVFKVKRAIDSWFNESAPNLGFLITASTVVNEPLEINFARRDRFSNKYQPSLVLFTKPKQAAEYRNFNNYNANNLMELPDSNNMECSKKPMYINFTNNYFNNFIIEPKGYESYQCSGLCKFPENVQSPNYSVLKRILNNLETNNNICCVPEKMSNLVVLYLSGEKIVLQQIDNMIVETCSCR